MEKPHKPEPIRFIYMNHRGETDMRQVVPERFFFGTTEHHAYPPAWMLVGFDHDRQAERHFLLSNIIDWHPEQTGGILAFAAKPRHRLWRGVRQRHLTLFPECAATGSRELLEVHHVLPYHEHPELELDPGNLITLTNRPATPMHFLLGHLGNWSSWNPNVREDAARMREKIQNRP
jgi:5-methylcytosine-specific restriction protein A